MRDNDVAGRQCRTELLDHIKQGIIIGNKYLDEVAHLGQFGRRTDEVGNGSRRSVPDKNLEGFITEHLPYPTADEPKAYQSNVFSRST
jgi:hypothetical protein